MSEMFETGKVGCFLDTITHSTENRRGDEVKVVVLTLRVDPFDVKLALSLDERVRATLFKLSHPDPQPHLRRADFALGIPRQNLNVFASPDTKKASICLTQAAITGLYARTQKDANGYVLVFKASFGPVGREELAFIEDWRTSQKFVTFDEAEPSMDFDDPDDDDEDEAPRSTRPAPMWEEPSPESLQALQRALLEKRCFLTAELLAALTDAEREGLAKWAKAKGGPVWPPVLAKSHVAGEAPDGSITCRKCGQPFPADSQVGDIAGLDCAGVDLEDARPIAKRGSKKTKKVDHDALRDDQASDGKARTATH